MKNKLREILDDKKNRKNLIKQLQDQIWNLDNPNPILSELVYDLDFYEPDQELRKEAPSFYGDEQLEKEIKLALEKLDDADQSK